ncbi:chloride channel protein [candidate division KSB1 bacterium]|nr:chloride channel protein [candidate division KSB1 bacterium]
MLFHRYLHKRLRALIFRFIEYTHFSRITYLMLLACLIGIVGGFGSIAIRFLIEQVHHFALNHDGELLARIDNLTWYQKVLIPVIGFFITGLLVTFFAKEAKGHGVPEVMQAVAVNRGIIRPRVGAIKALASAITIGTGGSVGSEGPIVQIGAAVGSTLGQILKVSPERLIILVGCGAAAGIAAAFNAPIAGAFFALEVIIGNFGLRSFSPIVLSSVLATVIAHGFLGDYPVLSLNNIYILKSPWEIPLYFIFSFITGGVAVLFIWSLYKTEDFVDSIKIPDIIKFTIGGLLLGIILIFVSNVYGVGYESIEAILNLDLNKTTIPQIAQHGFLKHFYSPDSLIYLWFGLIILLFVKLLATNITLGVGGSGGIFAPSLFFGAMAGGIYGMAVNVLFPEITAPIGAYVIVGMGAVVAGTTHAPITAILILFEMTGDYQIILPMMITCTISTIMARKINIESIYTLKLAKRNISLNQGHEEIIMKTYHVADLMKSNPPVIHEQANFDTIVRTFLENQEPYYYVVNDKNTLLGTISLHVIKSVMNDESLKHLVIARDLIDWSVETVYEENDLAMCMNKFTATEAHHLPVIDKNNHNLLKGFICQQDIIHLYNREILRKDVMHLKYVRESEHKSRKEFIEIPKDNKIKYFRVPPSFYGKSLKELDLRARYNVVVIGINHKMRGNDNPVEIPKAESILQQGDIILVIGKSTDLDKMAQSTSQEMKEFIF